CIAFPSCEDCNIMIMICGKKIRKQFTLQPGFAQFCQRSLSTPGFSTLHLVTLFNCLSRGWVFCKYVLP
uniref:Uncharacterized protein n=1 Tax=Strix occidentalis caurina TaxID=311401 RepID=A0A8D0FA24_STROC